MKFKNKKTIFIISFSVCLLLVSLWLSLRPVEVIAVHKDGSHSYVLVKKFPFTEKGKLKWWLKIRMH